MNNLKDYILVFENIVPDDLCDRIIDEYSKSEEWQIATVGKNIVDKSARNVSSIGISFADVIEKNQQIRQLLDNKIYECAALAIKKYNEMYPEAQIESDYGYDLLRYEEGQFYKQHTDSFKLMPREISCSFALNDDYEGGEWGFFDREIVIKAKKGSVVMFPSNFMFPHEIMPVKKGKRYSIITWFI